jgi:class 3 adenylate cyclase
VAVAARVKSVLQIKELHDKVVAQTAELASWNRTLEQRVASQLLEIERIGRLKQFLPPQVAKLIISSGNDHLLESHRKAITVVSCDLRGFTAFAEIAEPEESMLLLREYHTTLGAVINKFEGTVERFAGDGLLVLFNDPLPCPDPSVRAVEMAVQMRDEIAKLEENGVSMVGMLALEWESLMVTRHSVASDSKDDSSTRRPAQLQIWPAACVT